MTYLPLQRNSTLLQSTPTALISATATAATLVPWEGKKFKSIDTHRTSLLIYKQKPCMHRLSVIHAFVILGKKGKRKDYLQPPSPNPPSSAGGNGGQYAYAHKRQTSI